MNSGARNAALLATLAVLSMLVGCGYEPANGDLIFQYSTSPQREALEAATGSAYTHMGIIYIVDGAPMVFEASRTVSLTPLDRWIDKGEDQHHVVKRLRNADEVLTPETLQAMRQAGEAMNGAEYDLCFEWSDELVYCSELVWKIYDRGAGVQIGELERFADFDLSSPAVQALMEERDCLMSPLEPVIAPIAMFESDLLVTVHIEN